MCQDSSAWKQAFYVVGPGSIPVLSIKDLCGTKRHASLWNFGVVLSVATPSLFHTDPAQPMGHVTVPTSRYIIATSFLSWSFTSQKARIAGV